MWGIPDSNWALWVPDNPKNGIDTVHVKLDGITVWPGSRDVREVHGFFGLMGYYCKFIAHCTHFTLPLNGICRLDKNVKMGGQHREVQLRKVGTVHFARSREAEEAFDTFQDAICQAPVLVLPEKRGEYMLHSDASKYAVGVVPSQTRHDADTRVIAFWSRKLESGEMRYPIYDRELRAIPDEVVIWHYDPHSDRTSSFHMDHATLRYILT